MSKKKTNSKITVKMLKDFEKEHPNFENSLVGETLKIEIIKDLDKWSVGENLLENHKN